MKMIEALKMARSGHEKILPQPQAESACRRPAAAEGPPILMEGGSAPPAETPLRGALMAYMPSGGTYAPRANNEFPANSVLGLRPLQTSPHGQHSP